MKFISQDLLAEFECIDVPVEAFGCDWRVATDGPAVDAAARSRAASILSDATSHYKLAEFVRSTARFVLDQGIHPEQIRAEILDQLDLLDPVDQSINDDLSVTIREALDDVLGPEARGPVRGRPFGCR